MDFELRKFSKGDYMSLVVLSDDEWKINHRNIATAMLKADEKIELCFVATSAGKLIGYIYGFSLPNGTLLPEFLYVLPEYRKMGVGKQLLSELETKSGCGTSMIYYNRELHDYYKKQGYLAGYDLETAMKIIPSTKER